MRFSGKTAIVTGAASGIGRAVAEKLVREGARVVLGDVNAAGLAEARAALGEAAQVHALDVREPVQCAAIVKAAVAAGGKLDVLCNVAGVLRIAPVASFTPDEWNRIIQINLSGTFFMCQAALPHLLATRGSIVNVASAAGLVGVPFNAPYCASKHGVMGMTRALALELAKDGVRVNAVCPGGTRTPMTSAMPDPGVDFAMLERSRGWLGGGEYCEPSDIADAIAFLASPEAQWITGVALPVDAGMTAF